MIAFTVLGFVVEGGKYLNFSLDLFADTPVDAIEKALQQNSRLVVSSVRRGKAGKLTDY